jgi:hypothetical protein
VGANVFPDDISQISRHALHLAVSQATDRAVNARRHAIVEEVVGECLNPDFVCLTHVHQVLSRVSWLV